jgi:hypothetical protein
MRKFPTLIPTTLTFTPQSARQDSWGRLTRLTSAGAEVSTPVRLVKGEDVMLSFELGPETLREMRARVFWAEDDADGRRLAELAFLDAVDRSRLAKVLLDVLARY